MQSTSVIDAVVFLKTYMLTERIFLEDQFEPYLSDYIGILKSVFEGYPADFSAKFIEKFSLKWTFDPTFTQARRMVFKTLEEMLKSEAEPSAIEQPGA